MMSGSFTLAKSESAKNRVFFILFAIITLVMGVFCFYRLDAAGTQSTDEARHIINAYEMMKREEMWIHTFRGETDYFNYKPPLSMWCIILSFKLFGVNYYSMRLYSAVSMLLTFWLVSFFLWKKYGRREALIGGLMFISSSDLFAFHMARSGDADALYILLFSAAMLCLYFTEKKPWLLTACGFFLALAFGAKCYHIAMGAVIALCYLPRLYKKLKPRHYIGAVLGGGIPVALWIIKRYRYDGLTFFQGMLGSEVVNRVQGAKDYFAYFRYFLMRPTVIFLLLAMGTALIYLALNPSEGEKKKNLFGRLAHHEWYLFVVWLFVPLLGFSASGAFLSWYCYICYIPFYILCALILAKASRKKPGITAVAFCFLLLGTGWGIRETVRDLSILEYKCNTTIRKDLVELMEAHPEYAGNRIYIENGRNNYNQQSQWEQDCIADAYIAGDLQPVDGGISGFLEEKESILIIDKDLYESYSDVLAGRVVLLDGDGYFVFSNDFY